MAVVNWISQLEGKHGIGAHRLELPLQLGRREPIVVQPVVPLDPLEHLELSAHQPIAARVNQSDVRMVGVRRAELTGAPLLLSVPVELGVA